MTQIERRHYQIIESKLIRASEGEAEAKPRLEGYAAVFDSESEPMRDFVEIVKPGAFARSLSEAETSGRRIHALWAHREDQPLGSTTGGKLQLREDENGLWFSLDTSRFTPAQLDAAADGDLKMSFGFMIREQNWREDENGVTRELVDIHLEEVSPVIMPAYNDTSAALRSLAEFRSAKTAQEVEVTAEGFGGLRKSQSNTITRKLDALSRKLALK